MGKQHITVKTMNESNCGNDLTTLNCTRTTTTGKTKPDNHEDTALGSHLSWSEDLGMRVGEIKQIRID